MDIKSALPARSATPSYRLIVRLPPELKQWLAEETIKNFSSQSSEIVRAIRERMDRECTARRTQSRSNAP